jgi:CDP-paratose 2-epimerase
MGGSRFSNSSMLEGIGLCDEIAGTSLNWRYAEANRIGDHIWYISDTSNFRSHYTEWRQEYDLGALLQDIYVNNVERWASEVQSVG